MCRVASFFFRFWKNNKWSHFPDQNEVHIPKIIAIGSVVPELTISLRQPVSQWASQPRKALYTGRPTTNRRCWFWITDKRLKIIQFCFLSVDVTYLGFCLRPKSSISEHWSSQNVKIRWGGHFEIKWKENRDSFYWTLLTFLFLLRFIMFCNANNKLMLKIKVIITILETLPFINWFFFKFLVILPFSVAIFTFNSYFTFF